MDICETVLECPPTWILQASMHGKRQGPRADIAQGHRVSQKKKEKKKKNKHLCFFFFF
jgi:hypothetical protein